MSIEEYIKIYEELQKYKWIVANIDKDFFFKFVDNLLSDYTRQKQINEEHQKEIAELKEYIFIAPNLDEMTATKYANIQREAYTKGRAEEQQRAEYIIYKNFIPKQKIKDKFEKIQLLYENNLKKIDLKEVEKIDRKIFEGIRLEAQRDLARELLQESEDK